VKRGLFITFEGAEGSGKSTQIQMLASALQKQGHRVYVTREPGGTKAGEVLRKIHKSLPILPLTELFIIEASRAEHVETVIRPRLEAGEIVISDRFQESSLVYQGFCGGIDQKKIRLLNSMATNGLNPDLIIWLDISPEKISSRLKNRKNSTDRFDNAGEAFHKKIVLAYRKLAKLQTRPKLQRYSAEQNKRKLHEAILKQVLERLKRRARC